MFLYKIRKKIITKYFKSDENQYKKPSFSQSGEDLIVKFIFDQLGIKNLDLIDCITNKGYLVYADTNINTIFVKKEIWRRIKK